MSFNNIWGIIMLKFIKCEITITKPFSTDINLKFEDRIVSKDNYLLLKNRLDKYEWYLDCEHSMDSDVDYDEFSSKLLINITIIIPNRLMSNDSEKTKQLVDGHINRFQKFYERTIQSFNYKKKGRLDLNPI